MLEGLLTSLLASVLGDYCDVSREQLQLSVFSLASGVRLRNVK